jgi:photosystem II stability/assembly factor-like uncharacterized protein
MASHPDAPARMFASTEPAGIFFSRDGAKTWSACPEVTQLRDAHGWYLPYSPEAGCVRGFAFHGSRAYAAVEVGGVLIHSQPLFFVHPDVHSIAVHPSSPDLVFAPTGGGFYRSTDGGKTWVCLYRCYCRAAWLDPDDPDHLLLGPADGVNQNGRIEETHGGGQTWHFASMGSKVPWQRHMVERFVQVDDELLAVLSNGHLLAALSEKLEWRRILPH